MRLKPSDIRYSQDSINNYFDKRSSHSRKTIGETLDDLCEKRNSLHVRSIPTITVVEEGGHWITADNRRLWVFRELERLGKCDTIPVSIGSSIPSRKRTSNNDGKSIDVRGSPGGRWHHKATVYRPSPTTSTSNTPSPTTSTCNTPSPTTSTCNTPSPTTSTSNTTSPTTSTSYIPSPTTSTSNTPSPTTSTSIKPPEEGSASSCKTGNRVQPVQNKPCRVDESRSSTKDDYTFKIPAPIRIKSLKGRSLLNSIDNPFVGLCTPIRSSFRWNTSVRSTPYGRSMDSHYQPRVKEFHQTMKRTTSSSYNLTNRNNGIPTYRYEPLSWFGVGNGNTSARISKKNYYTLKQSSEFLKKLPDFYKSDMVSEVGASTIRTSRYTYGVETWTEFIEGVHPERLKTVTTEGRAICAGCFSTHIKKGETLEIGGYFVTHTYRPALTGAKRISIKIYRSSQTSPMFVDDGGCSFRGQFDIDLTGFTIYDDKGVQIQMFYNYGLKLGISATVKKTGEVYTAKVI